MSKPLPLEEMLRHLRKDLLWMEGFSQALPGDSGKQLRIRLESSRRTLKDLENAYSKQDRPSQATRHEDYDDSGETVTAKDVNVNHDR